MQSSSSHLYYSPLANIIGQEGGMDPEYLVFFPLKKKKISKKLCSISVSKPNASPKLE